MKLFTTTDDDDGRTDGHRLDGNTISSPCEPNGSGELKMRVNSLFELSTPNKSTYINAHMSHFMGKLVFGILQSKPIQTGMLSYRVHLKS